MFFLWAFEHLLLNITAIKIIVMISGKCEVSSCHYSASYYMHMRRTSSVQTLVSEKENAAQYPVNLLHDKLLLGNFGHDLEKFEIYRVFPRESGGLRYLRL